MRDMLKLIASEVVLANQLSADGLYIAGYGNRLCSPNLLCNTTDKLPR